MKCIKKFVLKDDFQKFTYIVNPSHCFTCKHLCDIWYDSSGIYSIECDINKNIKRGSKGLCIHYREDENG